MYSVLIYVCSFASLHVHVHVYMCMYKKMYIYRCRYGYRHLYMDMYMYCMYMYMYIMYMHWHAHVEYMHIDAHVHVNVYVCTKASPRPFPPPNKCLFVPISPSRSRASPWLSVMCSHGVSLVCALWLNHTCSGCIKRKSGPFEKRDHADEWTTNEQWTQTSRRSNTCSCSCQQRAVECHVMMLASQFAIAPWESLSRHANCAAERRWLRN